MSSKIPTVQDYRNKNYLPAPAFASAVKDCEKQMANLRFRLGELVMHRALFHDFEHESAWEFVQEYVELAQDLQAINQKWELETIYGQRKGGKRD